jgi:hypothetical protein
MNVNPDIFADKASGFNAHFGLEARIPTIIPTKCRDSQGMEQRIPPNISTFWRDNDRADAACH